jgi:hypothetical protein
LKTIKLNAKPVVQERYQADPGIPPAVHEFDMNDMRKLFTFQSLTHVEIFTNSLSSQFHTTLDDAELFELSQAWPNLVDLRIPANALVEPRITRLGLIQLVGTCTKLRNLHITIDASVPQESEASAFDPSAVNISLRSITFGATSKISMEDGEDLGTILARIAPELRNVKTDHVQDKSENTPKVGIKATWKRFKSVSGTSSSA